MITFFVPGLCKTAGSKRAFFRPGMKFPVVVDACAKSKDWKADVKQFAKAVAPIALMDGPLRVTMEFRMPRPQGHFGSGKNAANLKPSAPAYPCGRPDVLKMARAVEDALTGVIWGDDSQIVDENLTKVYDDLPGVSVTISQIESGLATSNFEEQPALV